MIPIRDSVSGALEHGAPDEDAPNTIVHTLEGGRFRAVIAQAQLIEGELRVAKDACKRMQITPGDEVALTPLPPSRKRGDSHG